MVSNRCISQVKGLFHQVGVELQNIQLGVVQYHEEMSVKQRNALKSSLHECGLELMEDHKSILIERIKNVVVEMVHHTEKVPNSNFSSLLHKELGYNYTYLAGIFSRETGMTIEHFIILHKIERAKELIGYEELNFSEIAFRLHYSSIAHLSNQFKKETGMTLTTFKELNVKNRKSIENV